MIPALHTNGMKQQCQQLKMLSVAPAPTAEYYVLEKKKVGEKTEEASVKYEVERMPLAILSSQLPCLQLIVIIIIISNGNKSHCVQQHDHVPWFFAQVICCLVLKKESVFFFISLFFF